MADVPSSLKDWSTTAASNSPGGTTVIGAGLDDNLREIQAVVRAALAHKGSDIASNTTTDLGAVAGLFHDITGANAITGFGTVSAGIWKVVKFEGAATLTHNATSLILPGGTDIVTANGDVGIFVSEGSGNWRCVNYQPTSAAFGVPIGTVVPYAGTAAPGGWLLCYGQAVSQTTYAALYALLGTTYGVDSGGNFTLPDLRGRVVAGQDDMGGSSANRLTDQTGGLDGDTLGDTGGAETHTLTEAQLASHTHTWTGSESAAISTGISGAIANSAQGSQGDAAVTISGSNSSTGSGTAHNNVQPTIILNMIIKY